MFRVLPSTAYTLKVGLVPSLAKYNLRTQTEVSVLLSDLSKEEKVSVPLFSKLVNSIVELI